MITDRFSRKRSGMRRTALAYHYLVYKSSAYIADECEEGIYFSIRWNCRLAKAFDKRDMNVPKSTGGVLRGPERVKAEAQPRRLF